MDKAEWAILSHPHSIPFLSHSNPVPLIDIDKDGSGHRESALFPLSVPLPTPSVTNYIQVHPCIFIYSCVITQVYGLCRSVKAVSAPPPSLSMHQGLNVWCRCQTMGLFRDCWFGYRLLSYHLIWHEDILLHDWQRVLQSLWWLFEDII